MKSKIAFVVFALLALGVCRCVADDMDTSQYMHPITRWYQLERTRAVTHKVSASKQKQIVVPDLDLHGVSLAEAAELLRQASVAADNPTHEGSAFHLADGLTDSKTTSRITITFQNVPLPQMARYVASLAGCRLIEAQNEFVFVAK